MMRSHNVECPLGAIPSSHGIRNACCTRECGECGGQFCHARPGGRERCCPVDIARANRLCTATHGPPCVTVLRQARETQTSVDVAVGGGSWPPVVTVATSLQQQWVDMQFGMRARNLGYAEPYAGSRTKVTLLLRWLAQQPTNQLIIYTDSDVSFGGCTAASFLAAYRAIDRPVVLAAEMGLYPNIHEVREAYAAVEGVLRTHRQSVLARYYGQRLEGRPKPHIGRSADNVARPYAAAALSHCQRWKHMGQCSEPPLYQFLNSGFMVGPAGELALSLRGMLTDARQPLWWQLFGGDQLGLTRHFLTHHGTVGLDYTGGLCLSLHALHPQQLLSPSQSGLINRELGGLQCFVHANGPLKRRLESFVRLLHKRISQGRLTPPLRSTCSECDTACCARWPSRHDGVNVSSLVDPPAGTPGSPQTAAVRKCCSPLTHSQWAPLTSKNLERFANRSLRWQGDPPIPASTSPNRLRTRPTRLGASTTSRSIAAPVPVAAHVSLHSSPAKSLLRSARILSKKAKQQKHTSKKKTVQLAVFLTGQRWPYMAEKLRAELKALQRRSGVTTRLHVYTPDNACSMNQTLQLEPHLIIGAARAVYQAKVRLHASTSHGSFHGWFCAQSGHLDALRAFARQHPASWYLLADDDTLIFPEQLMQLTRSLDIKL